ncbi:ABC-type transport system substrate-binding protein [Rhodococcus sp. 27YEA15]|uniref:ABC transporter substrate-binding protein n=1 Tax=Rhodococcus sp. 27YEA15 TaxID=3156259 RepID=UPI003C7E6ABF
MNTTTRRIALMCSAALISMGAVSCGTSDSDTSGHLRIATQLPPMGMNPHTAISEVRSYPYFTPVYDRLTQMVVGDDGLAEVAPMVATEWTTSEDGLSTVFNLRDDATFSDGAKLDAAAVKVTLDHAIAPESSVGNLLSMITSTDVMDEYTVRINTNRPDVDLPATLSSPTGALISPNAIDNPDLDVNPVGSGPYTVTSVKIGDSVEYKRRDDYWDSSAQGAETITIKGMTDPNARLNALRSGQIDFTQLTIEQFDQASSLGSRFEVHSYPKTTNVAMMLNIDKPALSDVRFRQALNYAVDRDSINNSLLDDQCAPTTQLLASGVDGFLAAPPADYTYNPEKARQLLDEAGIDNVTLNVALSKSSVYLQKVATAMADQLATLGIDLQFKKGDTDQSMSSFRSGEVDGFLTTRSGYATPGLTLSQNFLSKSRFPGTIPDELSTAISIGSNSTLTPADRTAAYEQASAVVNGGALDLYVCKLGAQVAYTDKVTGADRMGGSAYMNGLDPRYLGIS